MGFGYRKSVKLGKGVRLNLSKSGLGVSAGTKGARVSVNSKGVRKTVSVPGTGVYYTDYQSHNKGNKTSGNRTQQTVNTQSQGVMADTNTQEGLHFNRTEYITPDKISGKSMFIWGIILTCFGLWPISIPMIIVGHKKKNNPENKTIEKFNKAVEEYIKKNYQEALNLVDEALDFNPSYDRAIALKIACEYEVGNREKVVNMMPTMPQKYRDDLFLQVQYAASLFEIDRYDEAIPRLQELRKIYPENIDMITLLGRSFYNIGNYDAAIEVLTQAPLRKTSLGSKLYLTKYTLGLAYIKTNQKQKAQTQLNRIYTEDISYKDVAEIVTMLSENTARQIEDKIPIMV